MHILPKPLQVLAYLFPATYVFEAARGNLTNLAINWPFITIALIENLIYLVLSLWLFNIMFKKSKASGQFARNEQ